MSCPEKGELTGEGEGTESIFSKSARDTARTQPHLPHRDIAWTDVTTSSTTQRHDLDGCHNPLYHNLTPLDGPAGSSLPLDKCHCLGMWVPKLRASELRPRDTEQQPGGESRPQTLLGLFSSQPFHRGVSCLHRTPSSPVPTSVSFYPLPSLTLLHSPLTSFLPPYFLSYFSFLPPLNYLPSISKTCR